MKRFSLCLIFLVGCSAVALSQPDKAFGTSGPDPKVAFLKSLAVPGWGHHYVDQSDWNRGKYHLGTDVALLISYFGLRIHSNNLQQNWATYTRSEIGIDIEERSRSFQLAVGEFDNLQAYNDFQERSRNWDRLFEDVPENQWNWRSDGARETYNGLRDRFEQIDQQLPALIGLMVANRLISGISAYTRARKAAEANNTAFYLSPSDYGGGVVAHLTFGF